jgi:DinB superfamily
MNAKEILKLALTSTQEMVGWYLGDLSDADLLVRPVPGANTIAWQMGHLIESEADMISKVAPGATFPRLPAGFAEQHNKEAAQSDSPRGFRSKQEYLDLFNQVRNATIAALDKVSEADFDKKTGINYAPTVGAMFTLQPTHTMMHAGQFTVVRRKLGKPVIF